MAAAAAALPAAAAQPVPERCIELARSPWPTTASGRSGLLARLDAERDTCIDSAPFLSLLGALWLDGGDASQALLWLERSLMLEPAAQGTIADHALALAALGERTALDELRLRWLNRPDLPPALRTRLYGSTPGGLSVSAARGIFSAPASPGWTWRRSLGVLYGHESNLDHSPRLTEITLSSPDGPIDLPLAVPFVPRAGKAWVGEGSLQGLRSTSAQTLWQLGVQGSTRHAPDEPGTDQHRMQLAAARWQQHDGWRSHLQASWLRVAGPLNEPYRAVTLGAAAEREWNGCWSRVGLDAEWRNQDLTAVADSQTLSMQGGLNCRLKSLPGWTTGLAMRMSLDRPRDPARPGGRQRQATLGLRAAGPVGGGVRLELAARAAWLTDAEGYSPLLENNATRRQQQQQFSIEFSSAVPGLAVAGLEAVLQVQSLRQTSNLRLFEHHGTSSFAGLRWDW